MFSDLFDELLAANQWKNNLSIRLKDFFPDINVSNIDANSLAYEFLLNHFDEKCSEEFKKEIFLGAKIALSVYPKLIAHNIVSCQAYVGHKLILANSGNNLWKCPSIQTKEIKFSGVNWSESDKDFDLLVENTVAAWDRFVLTGLERWSSFNLEFNSNMIDSLKKLKDLIESSTDKKVTFLVAGWQVIEILKTNKLVEYSYSGLGNMKWGDIVVYKSNNLSYETVALMGHRGNTIYDSSMICIIEEVAKKGSNFWWGASPVYGVGEKILINPSNAIGRLVS